MEVEGPRAWNQLHRRAIAHPTRACVHHQRAEQCALVKFLANLACKNCCYHALKYYQEHPPNLESSQAYQEWVFNFHNAVNRRLGKKYFTRQQYAQKYRTELQQRRQR